MVRLILALAACAAQDPAATFDELLRKNLTLDLAGDGRLAAPPPTNSSSGFYGDVPRQALGAGFNFEVRQPTHGHSGSGTSKNGFLRLVVTPMGLTEFEYTAPTAATRRLCVFQRQGRPPTLFFEDEARDATALLTRAADGRVQLLYVDPERTFSRGWRSMEEALAGHPVEWGRVVLPFLRGFPVTIPPTPADPEVVRMCLAWEERPAEEVARRMAALRDELSDDDPARRAAATDQLKKIVADDPARLRLLLAFREKAGDPETRGNLESVLESQKSVGDALRLADARKLHRDLRYLAALSESPDAATSDGARRRLQTLTSRAFADRAEFDAWHEKNRARLVWDEAAGRYRSGE